LVEHDLVLSRALVELYSIPLVAREYAFRGGTALHKLILESPARYSEDIDLVQLEARPIGEFMTAIHDRLDAWLGPPRTRQGPGGVKMLYHFDSEIDPAGRRRLKIEVNTREHLTVLGVDRREYAISNPWFEGEANVTTYRVEELLGTKLRALYQRNKGRDLFDLAHALSSACLFPARIIECFLRYMEHGGTTVSRAEFEANLAGKANDHSFAEDVRPLLAHGTPWDSAKALGTVTSKLVSRIPGKPWKGEGDGESRFHS
jgi:predicted nucleotidyltransferase component of viral defense system